MSLWNRFRTLLAGESEAPDSEFWYKPVPGRPGVVTQETALRITAVWACIRVIAETLGSLPCNVYRREGDGKRIDRKHPVFKLIHDSPNEDITAAEFWELCGKELCTDGNFFARYETDSAGRVTGLWPMAPANEVRVSRDKQTRILVYEYNDGISKDVFTASEVLHIPGFGYDGVKNLRGYSPIEYARRTLGLAQGSVDYASNYFANNAIPKAYISIPQSLNDEAFARLEKWFKEKFGGSRNAGKLGILDNGGEIKTVNVSHKDMQFVELQQFQIADICRIFRVQPHLVQDLSRSTNNNIEHQDIEFAKHTMRPYCVRIERRINQSLFGEREASTYKAEFNLDALMRGDMAARAEYYSKMRSIAALNANEIRNYENLNGYPGGEIFLVQGAMIPVEMAGKLSGQSLSAEGYAEMLNVIREIQRKGSLQ